MLCPGNRSRFPIDRNRSLKRRFLFRRFWRERAHLRAPCSRLAQGLVCTDARRLRAASPILFPNDAAAHNRALRSLEFRFLRWPRENQRLVRANQRTTVEVHVSSIRRVEMMRRNIGGRVPGISPVTGIENSEAHSFPPRFAVESGRYCTALVSRQTTPDCVAPVNRIRSSEELRSNSRSNAVRRDNRIVFFHAVAFEIKTDLALLLLSNRWEWQPRRRHLLRQRGVKRIERRSARRMQTAGTSKFPAQCSLEFRRCASSRVIIPTAALCTWLRRSP